jgi:anti-sigma regulatory factor (Ser/Thr protein kinase)
LVDEHFAAGKGAEWLADLHVIVDEMASNVEKYAYPDGEGKYEFLASLSEGRVRLCFVDAGDPFDPTLVKESPLDGESDHPPGGLGILLVRSLAERMEYQRENARNVTTITLALSGKGI